MDKYKQIIQRVIKYKSISNNSIYKEELLNCCNEYIKLFQELNFNVEKYETSDNPIIIAKKEINANAKTILIYGHYDVQPANKNDGWDKDPFEIQETNDKFIARGIADNKGQTAITIAKIFELIENNKLNFNVIFLLEGSEETGSTNLEVFLQEKKGLLKNDMILVSDGAIDGKHPVIEAGFRGCINLEVTLTTSDKEYHSGAFGGYIYNASHELSKIISKLFDEKDNVQILEFYENVDKIPEEIINLKIDKDQDLNIKSDKNFDYQTGLTPSIEITGLSSGFIEEGFKNSIPNNAKAKLNIRTVMSQDSKQVIEIITKFFEDNKPPKSEINIEIGEVVDSIKINVNSELHKKVKTILDDVYDEETLIKYSGGSLPVVKYFHDIFDSPLLMVPFANSGCRMHAVNENMEKWCVENGLEVVEKLMSIKTS